MSEEKKLAVLIDSDNVSAKYAQFIMQEVNKYGSPTYKRVYGDWEKGGNGWHFPAINYSIMPVQQCSYIAGKNATDFSMIIDAMDILYTGKVDGFVLVTSDSDFTRLAIRLREAGMLVVGIGELKTPRAFTTSCHHFCYLNQVCAPEEGLADEKTIRKAVLDFVAESNDERMDLAKISAVLTSRFGSINFEELGYKRFSNFIDSFPELRRSNTFVSLKKRRTEEKSAPVVQSGNAPSKQDIISAIGDYFAKHEPERDNMMKIESYLNSVFGKIDFSRFGSKRFAKFIDKTDEYTREGTSIAPAAVSKAAPEAVTAESFRNVVLSYAQENMPQGGNAGQLNNLLIDKYGKNYISELGYGDFRKALASVEAVRIDANRVFAAEEAQDDTKPKQTLASVPEEAPHETATLSAVSELVIAYARDNMPDGGNIGQLNNELMNKFGRKYCEDLNFPDFKTMLAAVADIKVRKNHVYLTDAKYAEFVDAMQKNEAAAEKAEAPAPAEESEKPEPIKTRGKRRGKANIAAEEQKPTESVSEAAEQDAPTEQPAAEQSAETADVQAAEKPEINSVKRDILHFAATNEKGTLSQLGNILSQKYGKGYLKELGYSSIKKLLTEMPGIAVKANSLAINEEFANQTEQIEQFVNDFARGEGSHSIRALGIQLKNRFEGFSFSDYGFARFTDFINAIDGVKADRYHIRPVDNKDN